MQRVYVGVWWADSSTLVVAVNGDQRTEIVMPHRHGDARKNLVPHEPLYQKYTQRDKGSEIPAEKKRMPSPLRIKAPEIFQPWRPNQNYQT